MKQNSTKGDIVGILRETAVRSQGISDLQSARRQRLHLSQLKGIIRMEIVFYINRFCKLKDGIRLLRYLFGPCRPRMNFEGSDFKEI